MHIILSMISSMQGIFKLSSDPQSLVQWCRELCLINFPMVIDIFQTLLLRFWSGSKARFTHKDNSSESMMSPGLEVTTTKKGRCFFHPEYIFWTKQIETLKPISNSRIPHFFSPCKHLEPPCTHGAPRNRGNNTREKGIAESKWKKKKRHT